MKRLKSVKNALVSSSIVLGSLLTVSGVASAWGYPRVGNRALEAQCSNPDFFESIAMGQACSAYYNGGNWQGRGNWGNYYPTNEEYNARRGSGFSADRQFDRVGN